MAERRMFAKTITESDAFTQLPLGAQALYFHICMANADDDGFANAPTKIQRMIGAKKSDLQALIDANFLIAFPSNVVVVKHWKMHNTIQNERYKPTVYEEEKAKLIVKSNRAYSLKK